MVILHCIEIKKHVMNDSFCNFFKSNHIILNIESVIFLVFQKERMKTKQTATKTNKKQKSQPFISDPGILVFRDFVIGETMNLPFTLTNVSIARNTYKIIGFDKEYESLFNLHYSPPGYVSPGVPVNLSLDFTPKFNSQISCPLHCLAETGPFDILVQCFPKVVNIQIDPFDVFHIGVVTLGEEKEQGFVIRNSGALQATWTISLESVVSDTGYLNLSEAEDGVLQFSTRHGATKGYSTSTVKVNFKPTRPCQIKFNIKIKFSSSQNEFESFTRDLPIEGTCSDVPIFLENDKVDFGVCYYNELYRGSLIAHNRSSISQRFSIEMPPNLDKFIDFMPKDGFVQSMSSLQISLKLRTSAKFSTYFPQFDKTANLSLKIIVANQVLPVEFSISFTPSPLKLTFEPPALDFGTFLSTEKKVVPLYITSSLMLPCNFGFVRLPNGVSLSPCNGFGCIMPNETIQVDVCFQSQMIKKHEFQIQLLTLQGQKFNIPCSGTVLAPPITFSSTEIDFEATPLGSESSFKFTVQNHRSQTAEIEFETPPNFLFDPVMTTVPGNSKVPIFVTFRPDVPLQAPDPNEDEEGDEATPRSGHGAKDKGKDNSATKKEQKDGKTTKMHSKTKDKKKANVEEEVVEEPKEIISSDFTYKLYNHNIACFYRYRSSSSTSASGSPQTATTGRHHLLLKASSILPTLFVTSVTIINGKSRRSDDYIDLALNNIDFGTVATGQHLDCIVELRSVTKKTMQLNFVSERGSFEVLTPSCFLKALQTIEVRIRFSPNANMKFKSSVHVICPERPNTRIKLNLSGEGAAPSISLSSETLDFGHVVVGHKITRSIQVKNNANFALNYIYELQPTSEMHCVNMNGEDSFTIPFASQRLQPGQTGEATVVFSPDHDDLSFMNVLVVSAGKDGEKSTVPITACSWPYPMFIMGGVEDPRQRTAFDHYELDEPYFRPNVICEMSYPGPGAQTNLTFGVAYQTDDVKKVNGEFSFDNLTAPGFAVNPMKSNVEYGGVVKVAIEYAPPAETLLQVGQWIVSDSFINLKCGEFQRKVPFKLKCLINLQQSADLSQLGTNRTSKLAAKRKSRK